MVRGEPGGVGSLLSAGGVGGAAAAWFAGWSSAVPPFPSSLPTVEHMQRANSAWVGVRSGDCSVKEQPQQAQQASPPPTAGPNSAPICRAGQAIARGRGAGGREARSSETPSAIEPAGLFPQLRRLLPICKGCMPHLEACDMSACGLRAGPVGVTRLLRLCGLVAHFHKAGAGQEGAQERQQLGGA